tara:strand:- start:125 stop:499 length:375 start_codon:yes stop_codon:yes gene_type:complete
MAKAKKNRRQSSIDKKIKDQERLEKLRKKSAKLNAYTGYKTTMEELEDKCPGLIRKSRNRSRASAIRLKCYDCMGGYHPSYVDTCEVYSCPLWPYRKGRGFEAPRDPDEPGKLDSYETDLGDLD